MNDRDQRRYDRAKRAESFGREDAAYIQRDVEAVDSEGWATQSLQLRQRLRGRVTI